MNINVNTRLLLTIGLFGVLSVRPVYAISLRDFRWPFQEARHATQEARQEVRKEVKEKIATQPGLLKFFVQAAIIRQGKITAKGTNSLTVEKDGKTYTVNIDDKTQLRRRFWGKATLTEMQVGDTVNVFGKWTDDTHTTILARLVRDVSIQRRFGIFIGTVQSLLSNGFTLQTVHRGIQTVTVSSSTKFVNRREEAITQGDVTVGHRVRVRGLWDKAASTITEVSKVKDFSLPPITKLTPIPTPTVTP